jgi:hypothetical protein
MRMVSKQDLKNILGQIPLTAEAYWYLRQPGKPVTPEFTLDKLEDSIPEWRSQVLSSKVYGLRESWRVSDHHKRIFIFATLRYWLEHATLLGMALTGLGHKVTLAYLPYARWQQPLDAFNLRRQNVYTEGVLSKASPLLKVVPLLNQSRANRFPSELQEKVELVSLRDTQYTLQVEQVSLDSELYGLRLQRNQAAAHTAFSYLTRHRPDVVILPNGTILEFGVIYQVARYLNLPTVTYEFGEQRDRIWLACNAEVMRQETSALWQARKDQPLKQNQQEQVRKLLPSEGGRQARQMLGLDSRTIILLATNVIGDSLTLGRQVFSDSMTHWLERTVQYFANRSDVQLVIRIHPGELITQGPSVADVAQHALPAMPENIHLVGAEANINTYDLVEIADLGLVYTTTVGMEMAMSGVPVIVVGNTHYRGKGFTLDPDSWESYFKMLDDVLADPASYRISQAQVEQAWNYAYHFFFEYPHPFPWHLVHFWKDLESWPVSRVLSDEGLTRYQQTFDYLAGEPISW